MKVLIADDDRVVSVLLTRTIQGRGHDVTAVLNGLAAWEQFQQVRPNLVISDWMMPGLDGPDLCRRIRAEDPNRYTYLILLSSRNGREDRIEGLRCGADDFLSKPPDLAELSARLEIAERILAMQTELRLQAERLRELTEALSLQNARLVELVATDELTGLHNRRHFEHALEILVRQAERQGRPLSLAMIDVDQFKQYNDRFGHPAGDDALRGVADALRLNVRAHDQIARYGGEEFVILLADTDAEAARLTAERLREAVADRPWRLRPVTISLGIATWESGLSAAELLARADQALYHAKQSGRNRVVHYDQIQAETQFDLTYCV